LDKDELYYERRRQYDKNFYRRHRTERLAVQYERKQAIWDFYQSLKQNARCERCRERHPATLQFHHRDPKAKVLSVSEAAHRGWSLDKIRKEVAKCAVLCANCHAKLHFERELSKDQIPEEGLARVWIECEQATQPTLEEEVAHAIIYDYKPHWLGDVDPSLWNVE
jgi:hypothetical protein